MIVCHCMTITDHDIRAAVAWMRAADPATIITPGKVYRALGKRADCGGCLPLFLGALRSSEGFAVPHLGRSDLTPANARDSIHEGRPQGHRLSERGAAV
jgi:bacterioferritin-associated ferredoxin